MLTDNGWMNQKWPEGQQPDGRTTRKLDASH